MESDPTHGLSDAELADLARLADGTLPAERRPDVEARVAASPRLASIVERQGAALQALHGTAATGAPARLRAGVERRRGTGRGAARGDRRTVIGGGVAAPAGGVLPPAPPPAGGGPPRPPGAPPAAAPPH